MRSEEGEHGRRLTTTRRDVGPWGFLRRNVHRTIDVAAVLERILGIPPPRDSSLVAVRRQRGTLHTRPVTQRTLAAG
jgi:hypothetical protein